MKKKKQKDKYLDLVKELKEQWNMKTTVISNALDAFGMVLKGLEKRPGELKIKARIEQYRLHHYG